MRKTWIPPPGLAIGLFIANLLTNQNVIAIVITEAQTLQRQTQS